jgi:4-carboxymuconolactone decarboxylase
MNPAQEFMPIVPGNRKRVWGLHDVPKPRRNEMSSKPMRAPWGDVAPHLTEITDRVLFDDVWRRPGLSPRDRSLITVASLVSLYRTNELPFHLNKALENGVKKDEIVELITHLAFYAGWPSAHTAVVTLQRVLDEAGQG